jgi:hypothetical protein
MVPSFRSSFLFLIAAAVCPAQIAPARTMKLFNGRDLTGWYTFLEKNKYEDPGKVFTVQNGMLRISGEEFGGISTREAYRDYHLRVEWKWGGKTYPPRVDKARDSGILVHGTGPDEGSRGYWYQSIEYQIIEGGTGDFLLVNGAERPFLTAEVREEPNGQIYWQPGGKRVRTDRRRINWYGRDADWKDAVGFKGREDLEKPLGGWNVSEILCDGSSITAVVNGRVVNHGTDASQYAGKIQIQSEGAEIFVRKVEIGPVTEKLRRKYPPRIAR